MPIFERGWKPQPPDPYWSLPENQGGPSRKPKLAPGRPGLPPKAPPPSPFMAKMSVWVTVATIPLILGYTVFYQDFGSGEHIYSAPRRWLKRQQEAFYTLTPEQERLAGVSRSAELPAQQLVEQAETAPVGSVAEPTVKSRTWSSWSWNTSPARLKASIPPAEIVPPPPSTPPAPVQEPAKRSWWGTTSAPAQVTASASAPAAVPEVQEPAAKEGGGTGGTLSEAEMEKLSQRLSRRGWGPIKLI